MSELTLLRRAFRDLPTARVATVEPDGGPHVVPQWFVWLDDAVYVSARRGSRTWRNAEADPRVSVVIDRGRDWIELTGVVLEGRATLHAPEDPVMRSPISAWHEKYRPLLSGEGFERLAERVPELGFLRVEPVRARAWDHALP